VTRFEFFESSEKHWQAQPGPGEALMEPCRRQGHRPDPAHFLHNFYGNPVRGDVSTRAAPPWHAKRQRHMIMTRRSREIDSSCGANAVVGAPGATMGMADSSPMSLMSLMSLYLWRLYPPHIQKRSYVISVTVTKKRASSLLGAAALCAAALLGLAASPALALPQSSLQACPEVDGEVVGDACKFTGTSWYRSKDATKADLKDLRVQCSNISPAGGSTTVTTSTEADHPSRPTQWRAILFCK
jgi:hypothetical protein